MVKGDAKTLDRIEAFDCFELLSFFCSEVEEEATTSPSHDKSDGGAAPLSGKLVVT